MRSNFVSDLVPTAGAVWPKRAVLTAESAVVARYGAARQVVFPCPRGGLEWPRAATPKQAKRRFGWQITIRRRTGRLAGSTHRVCAHRVVSERPCQRCLVAMQCCSSYIRFSDMRQSLEVATRILLACADHVAPDRVGVINVRSLAESDAVCRMRLMNSRA